MLDFWVGDIYDILGMKPPSSDATNQHGIPNEWNLGPAIRNAGKLHGSRGEIREGSISCGSWRIIEMRTPQAITNWMWPFFMPKNACAEDVFQIHTGDT